MVGTPSREERPVWPTGLMPWWLSGHGRVAVVGESHYQEAIRVAVDGQVTLPGESGIEVGARLIREPGNPYDPSAVRVELRTGLCGHLAREDAGKYKPVLEDLARQGYHGQCKGLVFGGGDRHYGVRLELAHAPEAVPKNQPPEGPRVWRPSYRLNRPVDIRCAICRPEVLAAYEPRPPDGVTALFCTLATCVIPREKDQQQRAIEVHVDGRRAGELTWGRMTQRYADMLDRVDGGWVFCAELIWIGDAPVAEVLLPSVPETLVPEQRGE